MDAADEGPTSRPMDWEASFAEVLRKGVGASEVDGVADASLAESGTEQISGTIDSTAIHQGCARRLAEGHQSTPSERTVRAQHVRETWSPAYTIDCR
eukprot:9217186-Pyramimonas_sp.AAC.1